jgi:hypothetical protein
LTHRVVRSGRGTGALLMYDLAGLAIAAGCFAFAFALLWVLGRI